MYPLTFHKWVVEVNRGAGHPGRHLKPDRPVVADQPAARPQEEQWRDRPKKRESRPPQQAGKGRDRQARQKTRDRQHDDEIMPGQVPAYQTRRDGTEQEHRIEELSLPIALLDQQPKPARDTY